MYKRLCDILGPVRRLAAHFSYYENKAPHARKELDEAAQRWALREAVLVP